MADNDMAGSVRVRFAPSPTGYLHVGGARTALFNWLFARQKGGQFILRMEDTDEGRNTPEARETIFAGLRWLHLDPDEGPEQGGPRGPYSQSERAASYQAAIEKLLELGAVYYCFCTRERLAELRATQEREKQAYGYDGRCRDLPSEEVERRLAAGEAATLRLRVPEGETTIVDLVRGDITVRHADVEDIILVRADGTPVYNLAVVVDDHEMGVSHVLRGEDHLTNTFKQVIIFRALGWELPRYGHLPLILGSKGEGKLSKRKHPEAALEHYIARGYHPEAVVNWLALLGWSFDDKTEIMTRDELVERFSIERINKAGARLNVEKLDAMSGEYIRQMSEEDLAKEIGCWLAGAGHDDVPEATLRALAGMERERLRYFAEVPERCAWAFNDPKELEPKAAKNLRKREDAADILRAYAASLPDPLPDPEGLEAAAREFAAGREIGFGQLVHPVRAAATGRAAGPPLFDCLALLGHTVLVRRLEATAAGLESERASEG